MINASIQYYISSQIRSQSHHLALRNPNVKIPFDIKLKWKSTHFALLCDHFSFNLLSGILTMHLTYINRQKMHIINTNALRPSTYS
jgi:hypothetical protein